MIKLIIITTNKSKARIKIVIVIIIVGVCTEWVMLAQWSGG